MNTHELCRSAARKGDYYRKDVHELLLVHLPAALAEGLAKDGKVRLKGLGVFYLARPPGKRREGVYVRFRPSKALLDMLAETRKKEGEGV
ncbi:HU family DNA-binding protein [Desulfothermobacter acidiphilus]|uniref:HU family DNA-binding protein n=1 Tax=Desulfothermobacter acidiphilus TaxID=1938353 RepID=UPI003F8C869A